MYFVKQLTQDDCGFACLKIILSKAYSNKKFLYLLQDVNHGNYSYHELQVIAKENGVVLNGYCYDEPFDLFKEKPRYLMVSIKNDKGGLHMVILKRVFFNSVRVIDPAIGEYTMSKNKFISLWDKTCLRVDNVIGYVEAPNKPYHLHLSYKINLVLMRIFGLISGILGVFFLDSRIPYYTSIILFLICFLLELVYRVYSLHVMKKIDQEFLKNSKMQHLNNASDFIEPLSNYKKSEVLFYPMTLFSFCISSFIIAVFILNDLLNIWLICLVLFVTIIDTLIVSPTLKNKSMELMYQENDIKRSKDINDGIKEIVDLNKKSYKFANMYMTRKAIIMCIVTTIVVLFMLFKQIHDISFIVFYCFGFWYLQSNFTTILSIKDGYDSMIKNRILLTNIVKVKN